MRIWIGMLVVALVTAWGPVAPAQAQCTMWCPNGAGTDNSVKAKSKKQVATKKQKKPAKVEYLRAVPF